MLTKRTSVILRYCLIAALVVGLYSCKESENKTTEPQKLVEEQTETNLLDAAAFEQTINGKKTNLYWIENKDIKVAFTNYGGRIVGLWKTAIDG